MNNHLFEHTNITPITQFNGWYAKREDFAYKSDYNSPTGLKVRQYIQMCQENPDAELVVGCSADSAMQIYVAWASKKMGRKATIFVPQRKLKSSATQYAIDMGANVIEVFPGYASVYRKHARNYSETVGGTVRWDSKRAVHDIALQCMNLPQDIKRVIVPTGSGLVAAGIVAGLSVLKRSDVEVVAVCVSNLANYDNIMYNSYFMIDYMTRQYYDPIMTPETPNLTMKKVAGGYGSWVFKAMPDGTVLDPFYSAKAFDYVEHGDVFWVSGMRPFDSCPAEWRELFLEHAKNLMQSSPPLY